MFKEVKETRKCDRKSRIYQADQAERKNEKYHLYLTYLWM